MRLHRLLINWLLILLLAVQGSDAVSAKLAWGPQNLSLGLHQAESVLNSLWHQGTIEYTYDVPSGSSVVTKVAANPRDKVYRVWGDGAGLRNQNSGRLVSEGSLTNNKRVTQRDALPLHGNNGVLDELVVRDPAKQIRVDPVSGVKP